jgi:hypothetical protein
MGAGFEKVRNGAIHSIETFVAPDVRQCQRRARRARGGPMTHRQKSVLILAGAMLAGALAADGLAQTTPPPTVKIPEPGVPQIMTMEGRFVRAAYNNEGYVILGYRLANTSVGGPWLLLEVGTTVRSGVPTYQLTREAISLETPDGKTIPLASNEAFRAANLAGLQKQADMIRDTINYFPPGASHQCRIGFFADVEDRGRSYDQVELSSDRACVGRLYFPVAGGIQYGQHWLNVKFEKTLLRVPFRILTKDEEKFLDKNYKSIEQQVKEAFAPKKP